MKNLQKTKRHPNQYSVQYSSQSTLATYVLTLASNTSCRNARVTIAEKEQLAADTEEALRRAEEQAIQRKKESHDLAAEVIKRELLESECEQL